MSQEFVNTETGRDGDQLGFAVFLALALHALVIFGIGFTISQPNPAPPALEVTLAQYHSQEAPEEADKLAAQNQLGSGNNDNRNELSTDQISELPAAVDRDASELTTSITQRMAAQPNAVVTTLADSPRKAASAQLAEHAPGDQQLNTDARQQQELASLRAELDRKRREYSKLPRIHRLTTASTRSAVEAEYMRYWVERVEQIGNQNYPREARARRLFGELRLAVTLLPDGDVESVEVLKSSGRSVLDQAAIRIVRQASPFTSFPKELKDWDKIEIIRTWKFIPGNKLTTEN